MLSKTSASFLFLLFMAITWADALNAADNIRGDVAQHLSATLGEMINDVNESGRRLLQFGGSFGGALLTSGSFTMMAASGGF